MGEATFSSVKLFFDFLGLREQDWMPKTDASFKLAIRYQDWTRDGGHFYHPFERMGFVGGAQLGDWWLRLREELPNFDYACFLTPHLCDAKRAPLRAESVTRQPTFLDGFSSVEHPLPLEVHRYQTPYGYHFDAAMIAGFLADYGMKLGVCRILDNIVGVERTETGDLAALNLREGGQLVGDLFIDCTGFRSTLLGGALDEPFVSFSDSLLCDAAVAMQVPTNPFEDGIAPYTTAHAHGSGWIWRIPLFSREGTGYVYSRAHCDPEQAEQTLRRFHGPRSENLQANHIPMRVGRHQRPWVGNCVGIGLSAGFVEPLESTTIFFIQKAIEELVAAFPVAGIDPQARERFNRTMVGCIDGVRDFLILHYLASNRDDTPFWRDVHAAVVPPSLAEDLSGWSNRLPSPHGINPRYHGFEAYSWATIMLGMRGLVGTPAPFTALLDAEPARQAFGQLRHRAGQVVSELPSAVEYLASLRQ